MKRVNKKLIDITITWMNFYSGLLLVQDPALNILHPGIQNIHFLSESIAKHPFVALTVF